MLLIYSSSTEFPPSIMLDGLGHTFGSYSYSCPICSEGFRKCIVMVFIWDSPAHDLRQEDCIRSLEQRSQPIAQKEPHGVRQNGRGLKSASARRHDEIYLQLCTGIDRQGFKLGRNKPCFASKVTFVAASTSNSNYILQSCRDA